MSQNRQIVDVWDVVIVWDSICQFGKNESVWTVQLTNPAGNGDDLTFGESIYVIEVSWTVICSCFHEDADEMVKLCSVIKSKDRPVSGFQMYNVYCIRS